MYVRICVGVCVCMCVYVYVYVVWMYGCMDVCIYVFMYVCMKDKYKMNNNVTHSSAVQRNLTDAWMHACIPVYACLHVCCMHVCM